MLPKIEYQYEKKAQNRNFVGFGNTFSQRYGTNMKALANGDSPETFERCKSTCGNVNTVTCSFYALTIQSIFKNALRF